MTTAAEGEISQIIDEGIEGGLFSAAAISVLQEGTGHFQAVKGILDPSKPDSMVQLNSLFDLASLTKPFVATLFMKLVESGQVSLETPVWEVVPDYRAKGETITFAHLLSHSSGLPPSFDLYSNGDWRKGKSVVLQQVFQTPLQYEPGTDTVYSCLGYLVIGYAIELLTGEALDKALNRRVLSPMHWNDIQYNPPLDWPYGIARTAFSRLNRGELPAGVVHDGTSIALRGIAGNAGLFGSVASLTDFGRQFLHGWDDRQSELLTSPFLRQMSGAYENVPTRKMGLGWMLRVADPGHAGYPFSEDSFGHTGFTGTSLWVDPMHRLVVALCTNRTIFGVSGDQSSAFAAWRVRCHEAVVSHAKR